MSDSDMNDPTGPVGDSDPTPTQQFPGQDPHPTTEMPATEAAAAAGVGAAAAGYGAGSMSDVPPAAPGTPTAMGDMTTGPEEEVPWYKRPPQIAAMVIGALLLLGLLGWMIFGGGGDGDNDSPTANQLFIEVEDETGAPIDRGFIGMVTGPVGADMDSYIWLSPVGGAAGPTGGATGDSGKIEFSWEPIEAVANPAAWESTITLAEEVPAGWIAPGPILDCILQRDGEPDRVVSMNVTVDPADPTVNRVATYDFPNFVFIPGDNVRCSLVNIRPVEATTTTSTTTSTTSTTVPETTTTVPETTTTVTTSTTTTTTDVVPTDPPVTDSAWDLIQADTDLSNFAALIAFAGLEDEFSDQDAQLTVFAPNNQAVDDALSGPTPPDFTDPAVIAEIVLAHLHAGEALSEAALADGRTEVPVEFGGPQPITNPPLTIGGAEFESFDAVASNGLLDVIDTLLTPQP